MKKYLQAVGIWIFIIPLAILNGGLREYVLINLGSMALPISGLILCVCIFIVAYFFIPRIKNCKNVDYIMFGVIWFVLTNLFDFSMILSEGGTIFDLLQMYDFTTGNLWILVVIVTTISPYLVSRLKQQ